MYELDLRAASVSQSNWLKIGPSSLGTANLAVYFSHGVGAGYINDKAYDFDQ